MLLSKGVIAANGPAATIATENNLVSDFVSGNWKDDV
jgi:hypothetical protein